MSVSELEKYLAQLQFDKVVLTETARRGHPDYKVLLGATTLQISTVKKLIIRLSKNPLHED